MSAPMPVGTHPPEPMIPRLETILTHWQETRPRSQQTKLGPSEIGDPCGRKLALRLVNPRSKPGLKWAALMGVWGHGGIEAALLAHNEATGQERYLVEHRVSADDEVSSGVDGQTGVDGSTDVFDTWTGSVIDWKFVGKESLREVRHDAHPGPQYRVQAHVYGAGWVRRGLDVREVRIVFLPRGSNKIRDGWEWSEAFDPSVAEKAIARVDELGTQADEAEREMRTWASIDAHPIPWKCASFCPYFRPEQAPDRDGCPGHTRVYRTPLERLADCATAGEVRGLWFELRAAGRLDAGLRSALTDLGERLSEMDDAPLDERRAVAALVAAGFHSSDA